MCRRHLIASGREHLVAYVDRCAVEDARRDQEQFDRRIREDARRGVGPLANPACWSWPAEPGVDIEDFQGGRCAVCGARRNELLVWDHDHFTGIGRGLLCRSCNSQEAHDSSRRMRLYRKFPPATILDQHTRYASDIAGEDFGMVVTSSRAFSLSAIGFRGLADGTIEVPGVDSAAPEEDVEFALFRRRDIGEIEYYRTHLPKMAEEWCRCGVVSENKLADLEADRVARLNKLLDAERRGISLTQQREVYAAGVVSTTTPI